MIRLEEALERRIGGPVDRARRVVASPAGNAAGQSGVRLERGQQRADGRVALGDNLFDDCAVAGLGGSEEVDYLRGIDLVEVADQGRDPGGRVATAGRDGPARCFLGPALLVGQQLAEHVRVTYERRLQPVVPAACCLKLCGERPCHRGEGLAEVVEPAGGVERDCVICRAMSGDHTGIEGVGPTIREVREGDDLLNRVGMCVVRGPGGRGRVQRLGEVGPTQAQERAKRDRRPGDGRRRHAIVEKRRDRLTVFRRRPFPNVRCSILEKLWRLATLFQNGGQRPDVGLQVCLWADLERRTHHAVPPDDEPAGNAGPLGHDESSRLLPTRVVDLNLSVVAAARVGGSQLEECGGRVQEGSRQLGRWGGPRLALARRVGNGLARALALAAAVPGHFARYRRTGARPGSMGRESPSPRRSGPA